MIIYDDHIWLSYRAIIYDDHEWSSSHMSSGRHLGSIWRHLGGWRLKRHVEVRSHIMCLTLEQNAKAALKFQFYEGVVRVPSIMTAYLQSDLCHGFSPDPAYRSRALYQHRENPYSRSLFGEYIHVYIYT